MTWRLKASTDAGSVTVFGGMARDISNQQKQPPLQEAIAWLLADVFRPYP